MNRIPADSDFALRFVFSDIDGLPVPMKGTEFDMWFTTRPGAPSYFAACRQGVCRSCSILDDGSVLVPFDRHGLAPGQLSADIAIHADDETMEDGCADIRLRPAVPVEIVDRGGFSHVGFVRPPHGAPRPGGCGCPAVPDVKPPSSPAAAPIIVQVTVPGRRPNLSKHVTHQELQDALSGIAGALSIPTPAEDPEIQAVCAVFQ